MKSSTGKLRVFTAALVHSPGLALRSLRRDPVQFIPIAVDAIQRADPHDEVAIASVLTRLLKGSQGRLMARLLFDGIPVGLAALHQVAIDAGTQLARSLKIRCEEDRIAKAEIWNTLSEFYAAAGDSRSGWRCGQRAVRLMRRLVSENRDHLPRLIIALQVQSKRCSEIGNHERAIRLAEDAASRALAAAKDLPSLRRYIGALDVLAQRFSMSGDDISATAESWKAFALLKDALAQGAPVAAELAVCELRLATVYTRRQSFEEALPHAESAALALQRCCHEDPNAFAYLYFNAVDLVVGARAALEMDASPEHLVGEARAFFQVLSKRFPKAFLPRLMMYLARESAALAGNGAIDVAIQRATQATDTARKVSELHGDRYSVDEGQVHLHLAQLHAGRGDTEAARQAVREAIACLTRTTRTAAQATEILGDARGLAARLGL